MKYGNIIKVFMLMIVIPLVLFIYILVSFNKPEEDNNPVAILIFSIIAIFLMFIFTVVIIKKWFTLYNDYGLPTKSETGIILSSFILAQIAWLVTVIISLSKTPFNSSQFSATVYPYIAASYYIPMLYYTSRANIPNLY